VSERESPTRTGATVTSRRVHTGRVISLDVDTVRFPDGSEGELEMIRHPGASAVVPFLDPPEDSDPRVLLIHQYRYAADDYLFEVPAGRLEPGEDPATCAARELREEAGYTAERLIPLFSMFTTPGFTDERIHLFLAADLQRSTSATEADEFIEVVTRPLSECLAMIERGEIVDAKSALAILYAAAFKAVPRPGWTERQPS
jgi:ADP-ribose pyrophosphatase